MEVLHIDIETYSEFDIKFGPYKYASCLNFEILLFAYAFDDEEVQIVDLKNGEDVPDDVVTALYDPKVTKVAHNAPFEVACLNRHLGVELDVTQWRCSAVWMRSLSFAGSLEKASEILGLGDKGKMKEGKRLIKRFCVPGGEEKSAVKYDQSEDWELFKEYCKRDVEAEMEICKRLKKYPVPEGEWGVWFLDQKINRRGMPIDIDLVEAVRVIDTDHRVVVMNRLRELTGVDNPNSRNQLLKWFQDLGVRIEDLKAGTIKKLLLDEGEQGQVREALELRQQISKSSIKKYDAISGAVCADGTIKDTLLFYGAMQTGRHAGRIMQPQNMPRPTIGDSEIDQARNIARDRDMELMSMCFDNVSGVLSSLTRSVIAAPEGKMLVVCDLSSIESVMGAWNAESEYLVGLFRGGKDPYRDFYSRAYDVPYHEVTDKQRSFAKPPCLGCIYGLGSKGLAAYAEGFGIVLSEEEAQKQVSVFREAYKDIPEYWAKLSTASFEALAVKGKTFWAGKYNYTFDGKFLIAGMPSGRNLYYYHPKVEPNKWDRDQITYLKQGLNRVGTHPGKMLEQITQGISRDVLMHGMMKAEEAGLEVVLSVHDELVCVVDEDQAEESLATLERCMTDVPTWCSDVPLRAKGYVSRYYRK